MTTNVGDDLGVTDIAMAVYNEYQVLGTLMAILTVHTLIFEKPLISGRVFRA